MDRNYDSWLSRRQNQINEGIWDWLYRRKATSSTSAPEDPAKIDSSIYHNELVGRYTNIVLQHLGIQNGATVIKLNRRGEPEDRPTTITDWATVNPNFYKALQRFVAGHIIGQGEDKSYLRISHHDAIVIINQLDQISLGTGRESVADEFHIGDPESLTNWLQSKVPTARDAVRQKGFQQGSQDFTRIGRGRALNHPSIKGLVDAGEEVVVQGLKKKSYTKGLVAALIKLDQELHKVTGKRVTPAEPKKKVTPTTGKEGEVVGVSIDAPESPP